MMKGGCGVRAANGVFAWEVHGEVECVGDLIREWTINYLTEKKNVITKNAKYQE